MTNSTKTLKDINQWHVSIILALFIGFIFLKPYLSTLVLSALLAYVFNPVYQKLLKKLKSSSQAVTITTLLSFFAVLVPLAIVLALTVVQANRLLGQVDISQVSSDSSSLNLNGLVESGVDRINDFGRKLSKKDQLVKVDDAQKAINDLLPKLGKFALNLIESIVTGVPQLITLFILYLFAFVSFLIHQDKIIKTIKAISPFDDKINNKYLGKTGAMIRGMVKGQLVIAFCQALIGATSLAVIGYGEYFFFALVILTLLSFIPLGGGIVLIPLGAILLLTGNVWQATVVFLAHFALTTNIDNVLRPKLVPKEASMPAVLVILSAFAGVYHFGFLGVIYGPTIMIVLLTTLKIYIEVNQEK